MAYTNETRVRQHTGWHNSDLVPSELVVQRIADAHAELVAAIEAVSTVPELLELAETELAVAFLLRSLANESGFADRDLRTSNLTLRAGGRAQTLLELAASEEAAAWRHVRPYLRRQPQRQVLKLGPSAV